jgi:hypothetical protein
MMVIVALFDETISNLLQEAEQIEAEGVNNVELK